MNINQEAANIRAKIMECAQVWGESMIDNLMAGHSFATPASKYLKRGLQNWLATQDQRIESAVQKMSLFLCDKDGNYDMALFYQDLFDMFKAMPDREFSFGPIAGVAGQGRVRLDLTGEPVLGFITNLRSITISESDFRELINLLTDK